MADASQPVATEPQASPASASKPALSMLSGLAILGVLIAGGLLLFQYSTTEPDPFFVGYARDAEHVYFKGEIIGGADVATFEVVDLAGVSCGEGCKYDSQDKNNKYFEGKIVE